eukprot:Hpha_TRINITY_DN3962_c0_g1::TRINITY_DN3962_c0_g1_i2::g.18051::m.18051
MRGENWRGVLEARGRFGDFHGALTAYGEAVSCSGESGLEFWYATRKMLFLCAERLEEDAQLDAVWAEMKRLRAPLSDSQIDSLAVKPDFEIKRPLSEVVARHGTTYPEVSFVERDGGLVAVGQCPDFPMRFLKIAEQLFFALVKAGNDSEQQVFLALQRCYSAAGDVGRMRRLIRHMKNRDVVLIPDMAEQLRTYFRRAGAHDDAELVVPFDRPARDTSNMLES